MSILVLFIALLPLVSCFENERQVSIIIFLASLTVQLFDRLKSITSFINATIHYDYSSGLEGFSN